MARERRVADSDEGVRAALDRRLKRAPEIGRVAAYFERLKLQLASESKAIVILQRGRRRAPFDIPEDADARYRRRGGFEQVDSIAAEIARKRRDAGDVAAGSREARHDAGRDRVDGDQHDDGKWEGHTS